MIGHDCDGLMSVPHPIPYQGSKRRLAPLILRYFPQITGRLIEPFAGSAAVSLAALHTGKVSRVVIGDRDAALISLWEAIVSKPEIITADYADLWHRQIGRERQFYDEVRRQFNQTHQPGYLLYLLARCVKAAVRYNANGEFNQSPDNRRKGTRPETMQKQILGAAALLKGTSKIHHSDYRVLLENATPDDLIYLDPPYQGMYQSRNPRYKENIVLDTFFESLHDLNRRNIAYILSYDGRTTRKQYGDPLPNSLRLTHIELNAGRSTQATLLNRAEITYESLYLSPTLAEKSETLSRPNAIEFRQLALFEAVP
ncbi:MAG: DNA adenine methylase [Anaerolineae bacterium]|nr:DNA adenine methylase [Anaerolineae bacterium]